MCTRMAVVPRAVPWFTVRGKIMQRYTPYIIEPQRNPAYMMSLSQHKTADVMNQTFTTTMGLSQHKTTDEPIFPYVRTKKILLG